ncbi:MAG: efflux RND transporter permease subunit, partial [Treponema sp.]|nr:efflux RND transporter permease subunit [Treponema sp.]
NILKKNLGSDILPLQESENANFAKSVCSLLVIVLCLLYCIMGSQFESFKMPLIMFLSIPPAFTGAFLFLLIFNSSLNINSTIALVVLFGSVVNNAILLYESILHEEKILEQTVIKASSSKIETILITTLTSMCTLIPFAIDPLNKNSQSSMALAIIGGLLSSLVITLGLLPKIFYKTLKKTDCLSKVER